MLKGQMFGTGTNVRTPTEPPLLVVTRHSRHALAV